MILDLRQKILMENEYTPCTDCCLKCKYFNLIHKSSKLGYCKKLSQGLPQIKEYPDLIFVKFYSKCKNYSPIKK